MTRPILLDTDVIVDFFRGHVKAEAFINTYNARIILSAIVVAELYAGVKGDTEQATLQEFVSLFRVVPVSAEIGKFGGLYKRDYGKSHGVGLADAILAATAEAENADLKTLNIKHYPMLKDLKPAYIK
ncbi:MAG: type II toxin-antitoxin system VapC family toxin [Desulfobacteraceae bacterium]|nr:MAG: type II toxin-antitoxin system VapC family toxin [Desulfobacteraceae bacterium]